jgi:hypothetical protein
MIQSRRCLSRSLRRAAAKEQCGKNEERSRKPDPEKFGFDYREPAVGEKMRNANGRNADRGPWKEVAAIVERRKEGDAESAVGHGIEKTVACSGEKKIGPERDSPEPGRAAREAQEDDHRCQYHGKEKRVSETAMTPEITVVNAKSEADHVDVGNDGTCCAPSPNTLWDFRAIEAGSDPERGDSMREDGGQVAMPFRWTTALQTLEEESLGRPVEISTAGAGREGVVGPELSSLDFFHSPMEWGFGGVYSVRSGDLRFAGGACAGKGDS